MIFKISFSVSGDNFWPEEIINNVSGDFVIESQFSPTDKKFDDSDDMYGYGGIIFWHPKKFVLEERVSKYEKAFLNFVERNYSLFLGNSAEHFQLYIEIYHEGDQCNFEVFNKKLLRKLANFDVSIPISIYVLGENEYRQWEDEIRLTWVKSRA